MRDIEPRVTIRVKEFTGEGRYAYLVTRIFGALSGMVMFVIIFSFAVGLLYVNTTGIWNMITLWVLILGNAAVIVGTTLNIILIFRWLDPMNWGKHGDVPDRGRED